MKSPDHPVNGVLKTLERGEATEDLSQETSLDILSIVFDAINSTVGGVIIADLGDTVRYANPSFLRMFECSHNEIIGQSVATLFSSIDIRDLSDVITIIDISKDHTKEFIVRTKQNRRLVVEVAASNVTTRSGEEVGRMASFVDITKRKELEMERENLIAGLKEALDKIKTLKGIIPICASFKKIRDDEGYWNDVERYIKEHSEAEFSHGICPQCSHRVYQEYDL